MFNNQSTHEVFSHKSSDGPIASGVSAASSLGNEESLDAFREDLSFNDFQNLDGARSHEEEVTAPDTEEEKEGREEEVEDTKEPGTLTEVLKTPPHTPRQQHQQLQQGDDDRTVEPVELVGPVSDSHKAESDGSRRVVEPHHDLRSTAKPTVPGME